MQVHLVGAGPAECAPIALSATEIELSASADGASVTAVLNSAWLTGSRTVGLWAWYSHGSSFQAPLASYTRAGGADFVSWSGGAGARPADCRQVAPQLAGSRSPTEHCDRREFGKSKFQAARRAARHGRPATVLRVRQHKTTLCAPTVRACSVQGSGGLANLVAKSRDRGAEELARLGSVVRIEVGGGGSQGTAHDVTATGCGRSFRTSSSR